MGTNENPSKRLHGNPREPPLYKSHVKSINRNLREPTGTPLYKSHGKSIDRNLREPTGTPPVQESW